MAKDPKRSVPTPEEDEVLAADTAEALTAPIRDLLSSDRSRRVPYRTIVASVWITIGSLALVTMVVMLLLALHKVVFWLVMATFLAMVLNPAVKRVQRFGLNRGISILIVVVVSLSLATAIGVGIAAPIAGNAGQIAKQGPQSVRDLESGKGPLGHIAKSLHVDGQLKKVGPALQGILEKLPNTIIGVLQKIAAAALSTTLVVILAIFLLAEGPNIVAGFMGVVPESRRESFSRIGEATSVLVSGYTTGVFLLAALNGVVAAIALGLTGVSFIGPLAVWAGLIDVLPIIGGILAIVPAALLAFAHSTVAGIVVVTAMLSYQQIKNHFLYPVVIGRAVKLNALLVLLAVLIGTELFQVVGAVLAIPIAGTIQAVLGEIVRVYKGRPILADEPGQAGAAVKGAEKAVKIGRARSFLKSRRQR
ncbi:MAG: AI-2E family transporter [Actinomycetota bacterium]|nr:AI-2E family transporter [Actinomycetota bacterium]